MKLFKQKNDFRKMLSKKMDTLTILTVFGLIFITANALVCTYLVCVWGPYIWQIGLINPKIKRKLVPTDDDTQVIEETI